MDKSKTEKTTRQTTVHKSQQRNPKDWATRTTPKTML